MQARAFGVHPRGEVRPRERPQANAVRRVDESFMRSTHARDRGDVARTDKASIDAPYRTSPDAATTRSM